MSLDVARARALTPGCAGVVHLNNAGAALMPSPVVDRVVDHLRREAEIGGYEAAAEVDDELEGVYRGVAALVGAEPDEIALVESATRAWLALMGALEWAPGDRIVIGRAEYASNVIAMLRLAQRHGIEIDVVDDDEHGQIDVDALAARLTPRTRLIALTHVPTNDGLVNPAAAVGRVARAAGVPFLLDACQSAGQLPLAVDELGCDALSATGRKFLRGPRGTGFLYVRRGFLATLEPELPDLRAATWEAADRFALRDDARRFETWESSIAGRLGLGIAVAHAREWGLAAIAERVQALAAELRARLGEVPGVTVHDRGLVRSAIVTFTLDGVAASEVQAHLQRRAINTSVSSADLARFDAPPDRVRASVHYYTVPDELARLVDAVGALAVSR